MMTNDRTVLEARVPGGLLALAISPARRLSRSRVLSGAFNFGRSRTITIVGDFTSPAST
jgi:hypothetical protein